jgi:hypothetical protein
LTSAIAVSVWPFQAARCSAVFLHSHETLPQDRPTAWTVPPRLLVTQRHAHLAREAPIVDFAVHVRARLDQRQRRLRVAVLCRIVKRRPTAPKKKPAQNTPLRLSTLFCLNREKAQSDERLARDQGQSAPILVLAVHVCACLDKQHRRLRVAVFRRFMQRRPAA